MRITSGELKGRLFKVPRQDVRPTQEKVREAIFSILAARIPGARVLDLFAGSGAMGLEAWSRGAAEVCWVESDAMAFRVLKENVESLCGSGGAAVEVVRQDALRFLEAARRPAPFDLILADPPYDRDGCRCWLENTLRRLEGQTILANKGIVVFEQGLTDPVSVPTGWALFCRRDYGKTLVLMLTRQGPEPAEG